MNITQLQSLTTALKENIGKAIMGKDEQILLGAPLDEVECGKSGKPAAIAREIGKRPVLAFGNSSGDYSMLNYAEGNPDHRGDLGGTGICHHRRLYSPGWK